MKMIAEYNVPVLISDDAHDINRIGRDFQLAFVQAHNSGIKNFINLEKLLDFRKKTL